MRTGVIRSSLFAAADDAGMPDRSRCRSRTSSAATSTSTASCARATASRWSTSNTFAGRRPVRAGRVLAAEFVNQGRSLRAMHLRRVWRRAATTRPTAATCARRSCARRSSSRASAPGFGMRRHPFQQHLARAHGRRLRGADGTRVRAAGDGVVEFAGPRAGYGNMSSSVHHRGQYSTVYAHLSRFAPGIQRGARVAQGDIGRLRRADRLGHRAAPALRVPRRRPFAQPAIGIAMPAGVPVPAGGPGRLPRQARSRCSRSSTCSPTARSRCWSEPRSSTSA